MNVSLGKNMSMTNFVCLKAYVTLVNEFCKVLMNFSCNDYDNPKVCQSVPKNIFPYQAMENELKM